ncbi:MAG TPA: M17 family peptidase N-terminal domain-containing protein, partial [Caulobacteraceae bacterium]|nr:M17 family peptidase N-terminal domain-containing protein [Caulobacteraceae bacterium]
MKIEFVAADAVAGKSVALAVVAFEKIALSGAAAALDKACGGAVTRAIAGGRFTGAAGQSLDLVAPHGVEAARAVIVGGGPADKFDGDAVETAAAHAFQAVKASGAEVLLIRLPGLPAGLAARAALGARLAAYRFDRYRTREKPEKKPSVARVQIAVDDPRAAAKAFKSLAGLADAVAFARDLVTEPANILYPEEYAKRVKGLAKLGLEIEVLGVK